MTFAFFCLSAGGTDKNHFCTEDHKDSPFRGNGLRLEPYLLSKSGRKASGRTNSLMIRRSRKLKRMKCWDGFRKDLERVRTKVGRWLRNSNCYYDEIGRMLMIFLGTRDKRYCSYFSYVLYGKTLLYSRWWQVRQNRPFLLTPNKRDPHPQETQLISIQIRLIAL